MSIFDSENIVTEDALERLGFERCNQSPYNHWYIKSNKTKNCSTLSYSFNHPKNRNKLIIKGTVHNWPRHQMYIKEIHYINDINDIKVVLDKYLKKNADFYN